jgi:hypothetical protein
MKTRAEQPRDGGILRARGGEAPQGGEARSRGRGSSGQAYGVAPGHMRARYWSRHATWKVTWALSGKVTVAASPWTGCAHHAQGWTGDACRCPGCVALVLCLPFLRSTSVKPPSGYRILVPCGRLRTLPTQKPPRLPRSQTWAVLRLRVRAACYPTALVVSI